MKNKTKKKIKKTLSLASLVCLSSLLLGLKDHTPNTNSHNQVLSRSNRSTTLVTQVSKKEDLVGILRKYAPVEIPRPIDPKKPFFIYTGQVHSEFNLRYGPDGIASQLLIYHLLTELNKKSLIKELFAEGFAGRINRQLSKGKYTDFELMDLMKSDPEILGVDFFIASSNFSEAYGISTEETRQRVLETPPSKVGQIASILSEGRKNKRLTLTKEQIREDIQAYQEYLAVINTFSEESIFNVLNLSKKKGNVFVVVGYDHIGDVKEMDKRGRLEDLYKQFNLVYVPTSKPRTKPVKDSIREGNLKLLLELKDYIDKSGLDKVTAEIK